MTSIVSFSPSLGYVILSDITWAAGEAQVRARGGEKNKKTSGNKGGFHAKSKLQDTTLLWIVQSRRDWAIPPSISRNSLPQETLDTAVGAMSPNNCCCAKYTKNRDY